MKWSFTAQIREYSLSRLTLGLGKQWHFDDGPWRSCTGTKDGSGSSYQFGTLPALTLPTGASGFTGSGAELQRKLDATAEGGTVYLAQKAVVRLDARLTTLPSDTPRTVGFDGASITQNTMWTSPNTHYVIALVDGTRSWFGVRAQVQHRYRR